MAASSVSTRRTKRYLLGALLLLLVLPAAQTLLNVKVFRLPPVGFEVPLPRPRLSGPALLAGTYQDSLAQYATQRLGFRTWLMRPRNQLAYSLFHQSPTPEVLLGRQRQLFERGPVRSALGRDRAVPAAEVQQRVQTLRALQDTLARRGKLLVFAIAPSKASVYAELLPDSCQPAGLTNYARYVPALRAAGINLLDFGQAFRQWKASSPYPLFPPGGTHWSGYGCVRAADSLLRYLAQRGVVLPRVRHTGLEVSTTPRYSDDDLLRLLNLLYDPAPTPLAYPQLAFAAPQPGKKRPRLLLVGDSFGYSFVEFYPYLQQVFGPESQFWYYNNELAWPHESGQPMLPVAGLDLRATLAAHDVVLLLFSEFNLIDFDRNFSQQALQALR